MNSKKQHISDGLVTNVLFVIILDTMRNVQHLKVLRT